MEDTTLIADHQLEDIPFEEFDTNSDVCQQVIKYNLVLFIILWSFQIL